MLVKLTAPDLPVTVASARAHVTGPDDGSDDSLIERAVRAATDFIERRAQIALSPRSMQLRLWDWPCMEYALPLDHPDWVRGQRGWGFISIPYGPVREITDVEYVDEDGITQTILSANYTFRRTKAGGQVLFKSTFTFPTLYAEDGDRVLVTFDAGYDATDATGSGADPDLELPSAAESAVLMMTEHLYAHRGVVEDGAVYQVPLSVESLINTIRVYR